MSKFNLVKLTNIFPTINDFVSKYFFQAQKIIKKNFYSDKVLVQFTCFSKTPFRLFGMSEIIDLIKHNVPDFDKYFKIYYCPDGTICQKDEPVLKIFGQYWKVIKYEGIICGILSRGTSIATNAWNCCKLTQKPIIYMGDRQDLYLNQPFDGTAAFCGGIRLFTTKSQTYNLPINNYKILGTMPHSLLAYTSGDIIKAGQLYLKTYPKSKLVLLIDYNNDVINDALRAAKFFGRNLYGVRVDTSPKIIDKAMMKKYGDIKKYYGGCKKLIITLSRMLKKNSYNWVKIIVSSEVSASKIDDFEKHHVPIDFYGIGKYILKINFNFTADVVKVNSKLESKVGRQYIRNNNLILLNTRAVKYKI